MTTNQKKTKKPNNSCSKPRVESLQQNNDKVYHISDNTYKSKPVWRAMDSFWISCLRNTCCCCDCSSCSSSSSSTITMTTLMFMRVMIMMIASKTFFLLKMRIQFFFWLLTKKIILYHRQCQELKQVKEFRSINNKVRFPPGIQKKWENIKKYQHLSDIFWTRC